ncbi:helix-turn-helix domain-containing protein [Streptomyces sp. NBC_01187]|uniref:helix-turn-helix domain-containing protein n=1 Tax=Streptomyces sp. NBC_01187 TaxID=2903766 RepID=UPI00386A869F|nr:helix-turn-helix domain-containing protein [Streptomyces sp. NBC_01187]
MNDEIRLGLQRLARKPRHKKSHRLTPEERAAFAHEVVPLYTAGASIRDLSEATDRSYGFVHRLLSTTEGVVLRGRGGGVRRNRQ